MSSTAFGTLLRQYRIGAGFSQEALAAQAGLSPESIGALERGARRAPYRETVDSLAEALRLGADERKSLEDAAARGRARHARQTEDTRPKATVRHLPLPSTSFVGRQPDIEAITGLLAEHRLVTITGSGGIGKTRVAVEVAARVETGRWDEVAFVDLSPLADGAFIAGAIEAPFRPPRSETRALVEDLVSLLRPLRALIVLDNCEHLIDDVALVVSSVLTSCERISFLATSRERLGIYGEAVYRLPSFELPPEETRGIDEIRGFAGVEFFMERAASFDSTLTFTDSDAATITSICRKLDGIPLALELAAARVSTLGLNALRDRLADGFVLAGGARNLPARQQTMLATILWSYNLLTEKERMLLDRLSVFSGGFTLAAAEGVCSGDGLVSTEIPDILSSLCDKSLVTVQHSEDVVRYRLLDTVRTFATQQLEASQQREALLSRHARWLADFGDWIDINRVTMPERKLRIVADPELDNARAAISWSLDSDGSPESALLAARIVGGLRTIWLTSGRSIECRRLAERTLALVGEEKHPEVAARLLRALIQSSAGEDMQAFTERAIPVFERIGDTIGIALLHSHLAYALNRRGLVAEAEGHIAHATELFERNDRLRLRPYVAMLQTRWSIRVNQGRLDLARGDTEEAIAILKSMGDEDPLMWLLMGAELEFAAGDTEAAVRSTEALLQRVHSLGQAGASESEVAHSNLAVFHVAGDNLAAARSALEGLTILKRLKSSAVGFEAMHFYDSIKCAALYAAKCSNVRVAARLSAAIDHAVGGVQLPVPDIGLGCRAFVRKTLHRMLRSELTAEELTALRDEGLSLPINGLFEEALSSVSGAARRSGRLTVRGSPTSD